VSHRDIDGVPESARPDLSRRWFGLEKKAGAGIPNHMSEFEALVLAAVGGTGVLEST
jgi:hypothetical protein